MNAEVFLETKMYYYVHGRTRLSFNICMNIFQFYIYIIHKNDIIEKHERIQNNGW